MKRMSCLMVLFILSLAAFMPANALPAFARREGVSCQMCHFRVPEIAEDGRAYLLRGLREVPPSTTTGAEAPTVPAPALPLGMPLEINWANYMTVMGDSAVIAAKGEQLAFDAGGVDLWAAGPLDPHWSVSVDAAFDTEGGGVDIEQAYGQYITKWSNQFGSLRFGQSLPFAILVNQGGPVLMPLSAPVILEAEADTGTGWTPTTPLRTVEVGAVNLSRGDVYIGVAQPHLDTDAEPHTDIYATADYLIGQTNDLITLYGYFGKASLEEEESFHRIGAFVNLYFTDSKAVLGYLRGSDDTVEGPALDNSGYFLLLEHLLSESLSAYARYDHFQRDLFDDGTESTNGPTMGIHWWAQSQVWVVTEAQFLHVMGEPAGQTLTLGVTWAF